MPARASDPFQYARSSSTDTCPSLRPFPTGSSAALNSNNRSSGSRNITTAIVSGNNKTEPVASVAHFLPPMHWNSQHKSGTRARLYTNTRCLVLSYVPGTTPYSWSVYLQSQLVHTSMNSLNEPSTSAVCTYGTCMVFVKIGYRNQRRGASTAAVLQ